MCIRDSYSAFTAWLGFEVNVGEYKVMGMAPYGRPIYRDKLERVVTLHGDGSFHLNMDYFSYHYSPERTINDRFVRLWGEPRVHNAEFFCETTGHDITGVEDVARRNQYYADVAASVQLLTEELMLQMVNQLHAQTGLDRLVMLMAGVASIRDVMAFPKTQSAACLLTQAPAPVTEAQLRDLNIRLRRTP